MIRYRDGRTVDHPGSQDKLLACIYGCALGRVLIKPFLAPWVSKAAGRFLDSPMSVFLIKPFIRKNNIDMSHFENVPYRSYNEFFSRRIKPAARPIDMEPDHLVAPCDSKLTAMPISEDSCFVLKHTPYTVESLLRNQDLARKYEGGYALIFRLTVDDYHRYCYIADGDKTENIHIPGILHTVNPIANDHYPIYKENSREYSVLHTEYFGNVLMMEVGALLVGKIVNHHEEARVTRGQEKGYFQFGGSTVILLFEKDTVQIDSDILENSRNSIETVVKMGEAIGCAIQ